jgi:hyperpolarization activated cyclic nucleotide-gated potassium channel 1
VDFDVTCWVVRTESQDSSDLHKYLLSIYWAITTAATVGYGDIVPFSNMEILLAVSWMVVGVGFYSYTVGSLSSFLTSIDTRDSVLAMKLAAVTEFSKETGISQDIRNKLREAVKYNAFRMGNVWSDKHSLFTELPKALKYEVVWSVYEGAVKDFAVFSFFDSSFVAALVPLLLPLHIGDGEYVYQAGDYPDEVFFILYGRINFVLQPSEIAYKSFLRGSYIGEIEIFQKVNRLNSALCYGIGELLVLSKADLFRVLADFPAEKKEFRRLAFERASRNKQAYLETLELLKMKAALGSLNILAGKDRILSVENELDSDVPIADQFKFRLKALQEEVKSHISGLLELGETVLKAQEILRELLEVTDRSPFVELADRTVQEASTEEEGAGN